ncbi:MAG: ankyrin repeat domain-containing protein [Alphaproteobacteria bacterium]|nr:ankyrin repeat domain-containing protein [Alphaproteobacteria bacterium]
MYVKYDKDINISKWIRRAGFTGDEDEQIPTALVIEAIETEAMAMGLEEYKKWNASWGSINLKKDTDKEILSKVNNLIADGVDVNLETPDGRKNVPLSFASYYGKAELVQTLIDNKADINHQNSMGYTALMTAVVMGHTQVVKKLLDAGAKVDIARHGRTALDMAKKCGRQDIEQLLIQAQNKQKNLALLSKTRYVGNSI